MKNRRAARFCLMLILGVILIAGAAQAAVIVSEGKVVKLNYTLTVDGKASTVRKNIKNPLRSRLGSTR